MVISALPVLTYRSTLRSGSRNHPFRQTNHNSWTDCRYGWVYEVAQRKTADQRPAVIWNSRCL